MKLYTGNRAAVERYRLQHRDKVRTASRKYMLKWTYGLSEEQYQLLLASQGYRCAVCRSLTPQNKRTNFFTVDHDHKTGRVRGLLCTKCNTALGNVDDDIKILQAAITYLESHG